ncbi:MAG: flagellar assembly protein FliH [Ectothiorhodospiraceae bacterium]|nr:flagellar assembly protein FliH [Ectothiorhodospiraceae bacterium]
MATTRVISDEEARSARVSRWELPEVRQRAGDRSRGTGREAGGGVDIQRLPTAEEMEAIRQAARDEGYAEGRQEGYAQGLKQGEAEGRDRWERQSQMLAGQLESLRHMLDALATPMALVDEAVEGELTRLALAVARQVVHRELQTQPGEVMAVIREAVALLPMSARQVRVHVNPEDYRFLSERFGDADHGAWELVEDAAVQRGGCDVRSESSRVDATLDRRLNQLASQLLGGIRDDDDVRETPR